MMSLACIAIFYARLLMVINEFETHVVMIGHEINFAFDRRVVGYQDQNEYACAMVLHVYN